MLDSTTNVMLSWYEHGALVQRQADIIVKLHFSFFLTISYEHCSVNHIKTTLSEEHL